MKQYLSIVALSCVLSACGQSDASFDKDGCVIEGKGLHHGSVISPQFHPYGPFLVKPPGTSVSLIRVIYFVKLQLFKASKRRLGFQAI